MEADKSETPTVPKNPEIHDLPPKYSPVSPALHRKESTGSSNHSQRKSYHTTNPRMEWDDQDYDVYIPDCPRRNKNPGGMPATGGSAQSSYKYSVIP